MYYIVDEESDHGSLSESEAETEDKIHSDQVSVS